MSACARCGTTFGCAMADGADEPCWCMRLQPVVPVPAARAGEAAGSDAPAGCWCPACLAAHIARRNEAAPGPDLDG